MQQENNTIIAPKLLGKEGIIRSRCRRWMLEENLRKPHCVPPKVRFHTSPEVRFNLMKCVTLCNRNFPSGCKVAWSVGPHLKWIRCTGWLNRKGSKHCYVPRELICIRFLWIGDFTQPWALLLSICHPFISYPKQCIDTPWEEGSIYLGLTSTVHRLSRSVGSTKEADGRRRLVSTPVRARGLLVGGSALALRHCAGVGSAVSGGGGGCEAILGKKV